ncbi:MAG: cyclic nucleotide-binding domain-containing protein [Acidithiobacillales bacterium]
MRTGELGIEFEAGQYLFHQGEDGDRMFVVLEGEVEILLDQERRQVPIYRCAIGDYVGEEVILKSGKRSADARAVTKVRVLAVDRRNFLRRASKDPTLVFGIVQQLNRRVRELGTELARLRLAGQS